MKVGHVAIAFALIASIGLGAATPGFASKKVTLRVRTWWTGIDKYWVKDIFEPYMKLNPHVKINYQAIPWDQYWQKQLLMLSTGQVLGEVMLVDAKWTQDAIAGNFMIPLDPYIKRDKLDTKQFMQVSLRQFRKDLASTGTLYGLPITSSAQVLYYNKNIFREAGMSAPNPDWTWEDAFGFGKKLTRDKNGDGKPDQWGWTDEWYLIDNMLKSYGVDLVDEKYTKSTLNDPQAIKVLSILVDSLKSGVMTRDGNAFYSGKSAMMCMGDWNIANFRNIKAKFDWDITVPPKGPQGRWSLALSDGFFIPPFLPKNTRDEAWKLIKFIMTTPKKTDLGLLYLSMMPSYMPLARTKEYLDGAPRCSRETVIDCNEKYAFTNTYPKNLEWHDKVFNNERYAAYDGKKSPEQAIKTATDGINKIISQWKAKRR
jgi:multiple sugar transport system substrate-binding protein